MLSSQTIQTVQSTVPLLLEHGQSIAERFYQHLLQNNPEFNHVFNQANQAQGQQAKVIAQTIITYAERLDDLESLRPLIKQISYKHASLEIKPQQYEAVGKSLLYAIQAVLELPDGHAALIAWGEAYNVLAGLFIDTEEGLYHGNEGAQGGWRGFRGFTIAKIVTETPEVKSFYLQAEDGKEIQAYEGGQYVGVKLIATTTEYDAIRQYSLSGKSGEAHYRITTKAEKGGRVSNYLHQCKVGDSMPLSAPGGSFTLGSKFEKHIFIAGGVGITPMISMLYDAIDRGVSPDNIVFIQCSRNPTQQIFAEELIQLQKQSSFSLRVCLDEDAGDHHQGHINVELLQQWMQECNFEINAKTGVYFCGPRPFMASVHQHVRTLGFDNSNIHHEVFGPSNVL